MSYVPPGFGSEGEFAAYREREYREQMRSSAAPIPIVRQSTARLTTIDEELARSEAEVQFPGGRPLRSGVTPERQRELRDYIRETYEDFLQRSPARAWVTIEVNYHYSGIGRWNREKKAGDLLAAIPGAAPSGETGSGSMKAAVFRFPGWTVGSSRGDTDHYGSATHYRLVLHPDALMINAVVHGETLQGGVSTDVRPLADYVESLPASVLESRADGLASQLAAMLR